MQNDSSSKPSLRVSSISRRFSYALIGVVTLLLIAFAAGGSLSSVHQYPDPIRIVHDFYL
jgi:hypothetical protein